MEDCESRLRKLNAEFEEFAYIVSHDLKAPVRAVHNLAGWLDEDLAGNLPGDSEENFRLLKNRVSRLDKMIGALLDYSRVSRSDLEIAALDIAEKVKELIPVLNAENKAIIQIQGNVPAIKTYTAKLSFVLEALLQNAMVFNDKSQAQILVKLEEETENIRIAVEDNGPGVVEVNLPKIFTMFYTTLPKDTLETTGAGLAIANKIVTFAGGRIFAENTESGFRVTVIWPKVV
ncbi:sensor histidine kinase [Adhaeribacter terreus]|uniref:histidine kinase n=1 Tax=Adhaeribacter terreus TaxID=529703 RepID=A0ABW0E799_9BACT